MLINRLLSLFHGFGSRINSPGSCKAKSDSGWIRSATTADEDDNSTLFSS